MVEIPPTKKVALTPWLPNLDVLEISGPFVAIVISIVSQMQLVNKLVHLEMRELPDLVNARMHFVPGDPAGQKVAMARIHFHIALGVSTRYRRWGPYKHFSPKQLVDKLLLFIDSE